MDTYLERLVEKKKTPLQSFLSVFYYLAAFFITVFLFGFINRIPFLSMLYPLLVAGAFYGAWYLNRNMNLEYEYILTNDELDVDKIAGKSARKRLLTVSVRNFEVMRPATDSEMQRLNADNSINVRLDASEGPENRYYAIFNNRQNQRMLLIFNPTEDMKKSIKQHNMRNVFLDY